MSSSSTSSGVTPPPKRAVSRAWLPIGGILVIMLVAALFAAFSSAHIRHQSPVTAKEAPSQLVATMPH